jgi:hypothetical protein
MLRRVAELLATREEAVSELTLLFYREVQQPGRPPQPAITKGQP